MKVLIDTNILLDVLCNRLPFTQPATQIWKLCELGRVTGLVSAMSIPNIVYIMRKELDKSKTNQLLSHLCHIFSFCDLKAADIPYAATLDFDNFEDALQATCALRLKASFIVTRNIRDFIHSPVQPVLPGDFLSAIAPGA